MNGQTRKHSLVECIVNVGIGYFINIITQILVFPLFGIDFTFEQNIEIGIVFTGVSIARSYTLRRLFNRIQIGNP